MRFVMREAQQEKNSTEIIFRLSVVSRAGSVYREKPDLSGREE